MLEKVAMRKVIHTQGQFLSSYYLVEKMDGGYLQVINLKKSEQIHSLRAFQNGRYPLSETPLSLSEQDDLLCNIDLKKVHFPVPLNKNPQKLVRFQWSGNLYKCLCLCFGL